MSPPSFRPASSDLPSPGPSGREPILARPAQPDAVRAWAILSSLGAGSTAIPRVLELGGAEAVVRGPRARLVAFLGENTKRKGAKLEPARVARDVAVIDEAIDRFLDLGGMLLPLSVLDLGGRGQGFLENAKHPSLIMFALGAVDLLDRPAVTVVGTRRAPPRLLARAEHLARRAASAGLVVVSGGAHGIDLSAHAGALSASHEQSGTISVTGSCLGRDGRIPTRLENAFERWPERIVIATPYGPLAGSPKWHFAARNRFMAPTRAVVAVAGSLESGTRHTVKAALELGVPLFVYPGDVDDELAELANRLLADRKAHPVLDPDVVLRAAGVEPPPPDLAATPSSPAENQRARELTAVERLLQTHGPQTLDELAYHLDTSIPEVSKQTVRLEVTGHIARDGPYYALGRTE